MTSERFARQVLAFGEAGQARISAERVGIVGLGGLGSQVAQALAYLGVQDFVLVDDDRAHVTNLNRLIGALRPHAEDSTLKARIAERLIRAVSPDAAVLPIMANLRSKNAIDALTTCSTIFGGVDHDAPRLILSELAAAYDIVLIDSATELVVKDSTLIDCGGRVIVARPGDYCVDCAGQLDRERAKWELLSPEARAESRRHEYGLGDDVPAPSVVSLNGVVANIAVTEFLMMVTGIREPNRHVTYYGLRGNTQNLATIRNDKARSDCFICGYLRGQRERANIHRYAQDSDIPAPPTESPATRKPVIPTET